MTAPDPARPGIVEGLTQQAESEPAAQVGELADNLFELLSQHVDLNDDPKLAMQIGLVIGARAGKTVTRIADAFGFAPDPVIDAITGVWC